MLARRNRATRTQIEEARKKGTSYHTPACRARVLHKPRNAKTSQFAFVVGGKTAKRATARNLLKRRARHIIGKHLDRIIGNPTVVFYFTKDAADMEFRELEEHIISLLKKARIYT